MIMVEHWPKVELTEAPHFLSSWRNFVVPIISILAENLLYQNI